MKLLRLERKPTSSPDTIVEREGATLRVIDEPARWTPRIVESTESDQPAEEPRFSFQAEVRAKRFGLWDVDDERYSATIRTTDASPQAVMSALADACAAIPELRRSASGAEHLILQINLATTR